MSSLTMDQILHAAEQLSPADQAALIAHLQQHVGQRALPVERKIALLRDAQLDNPVNEEPSVRRRDWYADDGR